MITRRRMEGDDGATLVIVLVLVTFIAVVLGVILAQADTSARVTLGLSDQASNQYAADGAGQAAITRLRQGTYPNLCATTDGDTLALGSTGSAFYDSTASSGTSYNAKVTCTPDNTSTGGGGVIGSGNKPPYALLTLGTSTSEDGQKFGQANKDINVLNGNVVSDSNINSNKANLLVNPPFTISSVTGCAGATCTHIAAPGLPDPNYAPPTAPVNTAPGVVCSADGEYAAFRPGLYNNVSALNAGCGHSADLVWFSPGVYYFDFTNAGAHTWNVPDRVLGGTPMSSAATSGPITGLDPATAASLSAFGTNESNLHDMPGSCASPINSNLPGVEFVFGGDSRFDMGGSSLEICANYASSTPPIAIYGQKTDLTNGGSATSHAQSGCIVAVPSDPTTPCELTTSDTNGHAEVHVNGMVYAPRAWVDATYKNSAGQSFNWGLVLRRFSGDTVGSTPTDPFIQLPANGQFGLTGRSIVYLNVYVCRASGTPCAASGTPNLRIKVQITSQTAPAALNVLSWTEIR